MMSVNRFALWAVVMFAAMAVLSASGCHKPVTFPGKPVMAPPAGAAGETRVGYAIESKDQPDYFEIRDASGRVVRLEFVSNGNTESVELAKVDRAAVPHIVIGLDGVPFQVVEAMWREGHFRLFPAPTRTVATYPSMTDLCYNELLHTSPSPGFQAKYYDCQENEIVGGTGNYLSAENSPWEARLDYRVSAWRDAYAYTHPWKLFNRELAGMKRVFDEASGPVTKIGYSGGTAGIGTLFGEKGMREYLEVIERFVQQITYQRRGHVSITLTADHGHNMQAGKRVSFKKHLEERGWRIRDSVSNDNDVVTVEYGLVTYAAFNTGQPEKLAADLKGHEAVDLVTYSEGDAVMVIRGTEKARITAGPQKDADGRPSACRYEPLSGDPIHYGPVIEKLKAAGKVSADGFVDHDACFLVTLEHEYPDAPSRIWTGFHYLVSNPANVIVSLKDPWFNGSALFNFMVTEVSTHGSLNRLNSVTFVLSNRKELPAAIRQTEILGALEIVAPVKAKK